MNSYIVPEYFSQNELPSSARMNTIVTAIKNLNENLQSHNHTGTLNGPKLHATNSLIEHSLTANIFSSSITNNDKTGLILNIENGNYINLGIKTVNNDIEILDQGIRINPILTQDYMFTGNVTANIQGTAEINGNPVGTVIPMIGRNLVTNGVGDNVYKLKTGNYLFCNGATIKRSDGYGSLITILTGDASASEAQLPNISDGRFLKGTVLNQSGTSEIAGIPNIAGRSTAPCSPYASKPLYSLVKGSFMAGSEFYSNTRSGSDVKHNYVYFNASDGECGTQKISSSNENSITFSNNVYGKSNTVTPLNMSVNYFIRY